MQQYTLKNSTVALNEQYDVIVCGGGPAGCAAATAAAREGAKTLLLEASGMLGGMGASILAVILYAIVLNLLGFRVNYLLAILYGLLGSVAGVFGDLCFSIIKRQTGIKDYGNIFPGHGGILDRLDSLMAVAPLMEALLVLIPFAVG